MNAGVLQFALGIETSGFISKLGVGEGKVLSFAAAMEGVKFGAEHMWEAIEKGAALESLAARTDQSAQSLYRLEMGFKGVGLGADAVPGLIMRMQKSLSGVNEMGDSTAQVFQQLGLDMDSLSNSSAETQINAIAGALSQMGTNNAAGVASKLFGRFGAGDILTIARSMQEYQRVMSETRGDASVFGAMAEAWQEIKGDAEIFESHINAVWAAIASGITPQLHKVMDEINHFMGNMGPAIAEAFQFGQIHVLLSDALLAGLEQAGNFGARMFSALAAGFGSAIVTVIMDIIPILAKEIFNGLSSAVNMLESEIVKGILKAIDKVYSLTGRGDSDAAKNNRSKIGQVNDFENSLGQVQAGENKEAINGLIQATLKGAQDAMKSLVDDWKSTGGNDPHASLDKLNTDLSRLAGAWNKTHNDEIGGQKKNQPPELPSHYKPEWTSLEKIGFVMSGLQNPLNTTNNLLSQIRDVVVRRPAYRGGGSVEVTHAL